MAKNKRPQRQKTSNKVKKIQELRQSNAAGPHRPDTEYRRKPKYVNRGWDDE